MTNRNPFRKKFLNKKILKKKKTNFPTFSRKEISKEGFKKRNR
jgi:hypothetical protein